MNEANPFADPPAGAASNPYAAPQAPGALPPAGKGEPGAGQAWRYGKRLVMEKWATLPAACIKTNEPTEKKLKRKLIWHHPAIYFIALLNILIYAIVALIVQKRATIYVPLSAERIRRRRLWIAFGWLGFLSSLALFIFALLITTASEPLGPWLMLAAFVLFVVTATLATLNSRPVSPKKITEHLVVLNGVSPEYLERFPDWPYHPI